MLDTKALADATAIIVRDAVERATAPLIERIARLEAVSPQQGERGEPGAAGRDGVPGTDGRDGAPGRDGVDGKDGAGIVDLLIDRDGNLVCTLSDGRIKSLGGVVGKDGLDGKDGSDGRDGADGAPGRDGVNGKDGEQGPPGRDGKDGVDGAEGAPGRDGVDGAPGERGLPGQDGRDAYVGAALGLYDPEGEYRAMDVVSFNGSEWRAKEDDPGPLPGDGWMLSASRGKRGDKGERGEPGVQGKAGSSVIAGYVDTKDLNMTLTKDDGSEIKVDLYELADTIRQA